MKTIFKKHISRCTWLYQIYFLKAQKYSLKNNQNLSHFLKGTHHANENKIKYKHIQYNANLSIQPVVRSRYQWKAKQQNICSALGG